MTRDELESLPVVTRGRPTECGRGIIFKLVPGKRVILGMYDQWVYEGTESISEQVERVEHSQEELDRRELAAQRLRESLISEPYYAKRDKNEGMDYWRSLQATAPLSDGLVHHDDTIDSELLLMNWSKPIEAAAQAVMAADCILVTAGAGIGVDSGLPDFRGREGFWRAYPVIAKLGYSFEEMANPGTFENDPALAWGFYGHRLSLYRQTTPHTGFDILLSWAKTKPDGAFVFTSNVDGQFQKAGFSDDAIEECHGSIHHLQCKQCDSGIWPADDISVSVDEETLQAHEPLPCCPYCGSLARPNILMFDDWEWRVERQTDQARNLVKWLEGNRRRRLVVIECGAGCTLPTVRVKSEDIASEYRATLIRINPREPSGPSKTICIELGALQALTEINQHLA